MQTETEIQKLIDLINDQSLVVRLSAVQALGKLESKEAIPDDDVRQVAKILEDITNELGIYIEECATIVALLLLN